MNRAPPQKRWRSKSRRFRRDACAPTAHRAGTSGIAIAPTALRNEFARGLDVLNSGESAQGAARFVGGAGRGGQPVD